MQAIYANVSLDSKIPGRDIQRKLACVRAAFALNFREGLISELRHSTYTDPDGWQIAEPVAVLQIASSATRGVIEDAVHFIASGLNQEAIALYWPAIQDGKCVGPKAERWPFDIKFFVMPSAADSRRHQEAA